MVGQGRELGQRSEAELLQKQLGGPVEERLSRAGSGAHDLYQAAALESSQGLFRVDSPDLADLAP